MSKNQLKREISGSLPPLQAAPPLKGKIIEGHSRLPSIRPSFDIRRSMFDVLFFLTSLW
jgi:hypothetical protein